MGLKVIVPAELDQRDGHPFENSKYFTYGDYKIHYRVDEAHGKEKGKMFMIHGFGCATTFYDELCDEYVRRGMRCVRVDLPDFGFSTRESTKRLTMFRVLSFLLHLWIILTLRRKILTNGLWSDIRWVAR